MLIYYTGLKWAAGWNSAGSLVTVESTLAIEGLYPYTFGTYDQGIREYTGDGLDYFRGKANAELYFTVLHWQKHVVLMALFGGGTRLDGKATVAIPTNTPGTYVNHNCILKLPKLTEPRSEPKHLDDYIIKLTRLVAI